MSHFVKHEMTNHQETVHTIKQVLVQESEPETRAGKKNSLIGPVRRNLQAFKNCRIWASEGVHNV